MIPAMYDAAARAELALELADGFLGEQPWRADLVAEAGAARLDRWPGWIDVLALSVVTVFRTPPVDRRLGLVRYIEEFLERHDDAGEHEREPPRVSRLVIGQAASRPPPARRVRLDHDWPIAELNSVPALAAALELSDGQLAWLADVRGLERSVADEQLRNYRYQLRPRAGGVPRVVEAPKARLKELQRWILREILDHVSAHDAAHGFVRGRSVVSHARLHTGRAVVLRLDLQDFFASIAAGRVFGLFTTLGYPRQVAHVLTGITTNVIPSAVWDGIPRATDPGLLQRQFWLGRQLATPHLPQGAPTSPAIANLAAFRLDRRLAGLAASSGLRYSRYADDLTFSGPMRLRRRHGGFARLVDEIVRAEGFRLNPGKSVLRTSAARQQVCGVVTNVHPNIARREYDQLKAVLHNAARRGPLPQNRSGLADFEAHLRGRISWVSSLNPTRGERLWARFNEIDWSGGSTADDRD